VVVDSYVFHRHGEEIGSFHKAWRSATTKAGLQGRLFHDLRRSAARNLVRSGTPEAIAMAVTGHRSRSVFQRYNITVQDDVRLALQRVSGYVATLPSVTDAVTTPTVDEIPPAK
jgi:integrase